MPKEKWMNSVAMVQRMNKAEKRMYREMWEEAKRPLLTDAEVDALLLKVKAQQRWETRWRMNILDYVG